MMGARFVKVKYRADGEVRYHCGDCLTPAIKYGMGRGRQQWRCMSCGRYFLEDSRHVRLSERDIEVIGILLAGGCSARLVARAYGICDQTVRKMGLQEVKENN